MGTDEFYILMKRCVDEIEEEHKRDPRFTVHMDSEPGKPGSLTVKFKLYDPEKGTAFWIARVFDSDIMGMLSPKGYVDYMLHRMYGDLFERIRRKENSAV